jgi:hypothetical protein
MASRTGRYTQYEGYLAATNGNICLPVAAPQALSGAIVTFTGQTAEDLYATRFIMPCSGYLKDVSLMVGADSTGNGTAAVFNAEDSTRPLLWEGASTDLADAGWTNLGDPDIFVNAGQHLDIGVVLDNAATTVGTVTAVDTDFSDLPAGFFPEADASNVLSWKVASQATIDSTQESVTAVVETIIVIARVASTATG